MEMEDVLMSVDSQSAVYFVWEIPKDNMRYSSHTQWCYQFCLSKFFKRICAFHLINVILPIELGCVMQICNSKLKLIVVSNWGHLKKNPSYMLYFSILQMKQFLLLQECTVPERTELWIYMATWILMNLINICIMFTILFSLRHNGFKLWWILLVYMFRKNHFVINYRLVIFLSTPQLSQIGPYTVMYVSHCCCQILSGHFHLTHVWKEKIRKKVPYGPIITHAEFSKIRTIDTIVRLMYGHVFGEFKSC